MSEHQNKEKALAAAAAREAAERAAAIRGEMHAQAVAASGFDRPNLRSELRHPDFVRAQERIAEIRKLREVQAPPDIMNLSADLAPPGWNYQLKRKEVYGQEDHKHLMQLQFGGWTPVPVAERHPETYIPADSILMEKPEELVKEERWLEKREADQKMSGQRVKLTEAPFGTGPRDHPGVRPKIERNYEPLEVRRDE